MGHVTVAVSDLPLAVGDSVTSGWCENSESDIPCARADQRLRDDRRGSNREGDTLAMSVDGAEGDVSGGERNARTASRMQAGGGAEGEAASCPCRICLDPVTDADFMDGTAVHLGCRCSSGLDVLHLACAEHWFRLRRTLTCEVCGVQSNGLPDVLKKKLLEIETRSKGNQGRHLVGMDQSRGSLYWRNRMSDHPTFHVLDADPPCGLSYCCRYFIALIFAAVTVLAFIVIAIHVALRDKE